MPVTFVLQLKLHLIQLIGYTVSEREYYEHIWIFSKQSFHYICGMTKAELRKKYKKLRETLSEADIEKMSIEIANNLLKVNVWDKTYYHIFLTIEKLKEVDTSFILSILQGKDKEIVIAKSDFENCSLTHFLLTDNTRLKINKYFIPEPVDGIEVPENKINVIFVPLLAFDESGNRIGYGKGFYDRFLSKCKAESIKIGVSFFEAEKEINHTFDTDIKLDYCVTPNKIYSFTD